MLEIIRFKIVMATSFVLLKRRTKEKEYKIEINKGTNVLIEILTVSFQGNIQQALTEQSVLLPVENYKNIYLNNNFSGK